MFDFFDINFKTLVVERIPIRMRNVRLLAFLNAVVGEINRTYNLFVANRNANLYRLSITPQVVYLEKLLNDKYDSSAKRIYITDAIWHLPLFVYTEEELKPVFLPGEADPPIWLYTDGEAGEAKNDFVVHVPAGLVYNEAEMRSYLNQYRLFGTKYKIEPY